MNRNIIKRQAGVTLIELMAGLAIIAIIAGFVVPKITDAFSTQDETQVQNEIVALVGAARKWRGVRPSYAGVSCDDLVSDKYIENSWSNCTSVNPQGGNYTVAANGTNSNNLDVTATGLGNEFCNRVANAMDPNTESSSCSSGTLSVTFRG